MEKTGLENHYIISHQKKLRYGYTTGSCAAGAARAAALALRDGIFPEYVDIRTPAGLPLHLKVEAGQLGEGWASAAVCKDGGDDPDVTHGLLIRAQVSGWEGRGIHIHGGEGVGRVTQPGLDQPVGAAAINRVPRKMIKDEIEAVCREDSRKDGFFAMSEGVQVCISVPGGETVAAKTFNPKLGIVGGISILGTSGLVVPMSQDALKDTIRLEMRVQAEQGHRKLLLTPGNYGAAFARELGDLQDETPVCCSNFVGESIDMAAELGVEELLFVAHIGKFIKVAGGIMNTHSHEADARMEILTANALLCKVPREALIKMMESVTTDHALTILTEYGYIQPVMERILGQIHQYLQKRAQERVKTGAILFSNQHGFLGQTEYVTDMLKSWYE